MENLYIFRKVELNDWRMIEVSLPSGKIFVWLLLNEKLVIFILNCRLSGAKINNVNISLFSLQSQVPEKIEKKKLSFLFVFFFGNINMLCTYAEQELIYVALWIFQTA